MQASSTFGFLDARSNSRSKKPRPLVSLTVADVKKLVESTSSTACFADDLERLNVDGKAIQRLSMRDLLAMDVGTMVQRRALLKLVDRSKREGIKPALLGRSATATSPAVARRNAAHLGTSPKTRLQNRSEASPINSKVDSRVGKLRRKGKGPSSGPSTPTHSEPVTLRETVTQLRDRGRRALGSSLGEKTVAAAKKAAQSRTARKVSPSSGTKRQSGGNRAGRAAATGTGFSRRLRK